MSVQALTSVFRHSQLAGTARLVLLAIANYYGDEGAWPSIDSIAADCRMSRRAVQECIRRAEAAGELHVELNAGPRGANRYWLHIDEGGCRFCTRADLRRESAPEPKEPDITPPESSLASLESSTPPTRGARVRRPRPRDPAFDALAEVEGADPRQLTRPHARAIAVALAAIREVSPDVTPDEIRARAAAYRRRHPRWDLTAPALAKHWATLGAPVERPRPTLRDVLSGHASVDELLGSAEAP